MGLDLYCIEEHVRVGSYSYVHVERTNWIKATLKYLEANHLHQLLDELSTWLLNDHVNYNSVSAKPSKLMSQCKLQGLHYFVVHSDCDGSWKPHQSKQILKTLEKIIDYMEEEEDSDDSDELEDSDNQTENSDDSSNDDEDEDEPVQPEQAQPANTVSKLQKHHMYKILSESVNTNTSIKFG